MSLETFKLSVVLHGHSLDVRCVAVNHENSILSGSRDKTCKFWKPNSINSGYTDALTYRGHKNYVSAVFGLSPSLEFPNGLIITGGNDNNVCIYTTDSEEPFINLNAHENTVCCISEANNPNTFLTSSWDCTAKLWQIVKSSVKELMVFKFHQTAVWSVIHLPNGNVVTGSADKNVVIWLPNGQVFKVLKGHTDCVRDLALLPNYFISVANDASIKLWSFDGECLDTFYGHSNYIYSVSVNKALGDDCFVTAGEDRIVKFWKDGENIQTLTLPAQSVWSVACLLNGDIVTGSSDGLVRVFTRDPTRVADEEALKIFEEEVAHLDIASAKEIGGYKISDLPGKEVLFEPGRSDGQTKLVREDSSVVCYSWSAVEGAWKKVGDVMGAAGGTQATSGKTLFEGKEYDFVFSVDIEDNKPPLKLPYNKDQDPWHAAQEFIHRNNLSQMFLDQVANFIIQNSGGIYLQQNNQEGTDFVDPFTGASRYLPGNSAGGNRSESGSNLDPFTGGSSYTTSTHNTQPIPMDQSTTVAPDPFTGSAAYTTSSIQDTTLIHNYFPQLNYLKFEQGNVSVILEKLREFNIAINDNNLKVTDDQLEGIANLTKSDYSNSGCVNILMQKLLNWPADMVFPVLDIIRLCIRHSHNNFLLCTQENGDYLLKLLRIHILKDIPANRMLALRIFCNMFLHSMGEKLILTNLETLVINVIAIEGMLNKNTQIALSTFLLNTTISLIKIQDKNTTMKLIEVISKVLLNLNDPEAEFRGFVALGTALTQFELTASNIDNIDLLQKLKEKLNKIANSNLNETIQIRNINCVRQLNKLFN